MTKAALLLSLSVAALATMPAAALAADPSQLPDRLELGRDSKGDPCAATRMWNDATVGDSFAVSFSVTCRGATANRLLAIGRAMTVRDAAKLDAVLDCGAPGAAQVPQVGTVAARLCRDKVLGLTTVETRVVKGGRIYSVSNVTAAQGPGEELLRLLAGATAPNSDRGRTVTAAVDVAALAAPTGGLVEGSATEDAQSALANGLRLVRQGLYLEAARGLNDALSRLPADAPVATRIELLLVAGLADSNLKFFGSADNFFKRADDLLAANPGIPEASVLSRKRRSYAALDLLNRREFNRAVGALDQLASSEAEAGQPLLDPTTLRALNQPSRAKGGEGGMVATADAGALSQLVIDAQAAWARSVALLAQNRPSESSAALATAERIFSVLRNDKIDQQQVRWLEARIERQRARLLLRSGDRQGAVAALDRAVVALERAEANGATGPALAETKLERAGVLARGGGSPASLIAAFEDGIDTLITSDTAGTVLPPSVEQYLDLLAAEAATNPTGTSPEKFFRAVQAVSNPAIARQFVQLQSIVTANPKLASKVQDQQELEQEVTKLRFQIASTPASDGATITALDKRRAELEAQLIQINSELSGDKAYGSVNDAPATIADVQKVLVPGEAYFKLTKVRNYAFGILIDGQGAQIWRVKNPMVEVEPLAARLRDSIDGGSRTDGKLPVFQVAVANALYKIVAGPAGARLAGAKAVVVDPSGPLETLPYGVLVADDASVKSYMATRAANPYDFSKVGFMAQRQAVSSALSARSLIVSRNLAQSQAPLPFIGFAEHQPIQMTGQLAGQMIAIGNNCEAEASQIALLTRELQPIKARELTEAADALGVRNVPEVTGAAFTDTAVKERTDLDKFQVLHFATHGLTEGVWGCAKSPPALVTSLGDKGSDALLSFDEIAKLRLDANLVVLSACDTASGISAEAAQASGREEAGATLEGLVRAFLAANARAVLATYWPVSDAGESEALIKDFYASARSGTIGESLRVAQSALIANPETSHPLFWGAFFVVGDAQKPLLTGQARVAVDLPAEPARSAAAAPLANGAARR